MDLLRGVAVDNDAGAHDMDALQHRFARFRGTSHARSMPIPVNPFGWATKKNREKSASAFSGVLGMHAIQERPVAVDGQVVIRPMMYVALTYDHRIVDGREAVTFLKRIKEAVEAPARMLLEV